MRDAARAWLAKPHYTLTRDAVSRRCAAGADAIDRKQLPALSAPPEVKFPKRRRATLANGMKVILLERHSAPLVAATLAVDAGIAVRSGRGAPAPRTSPWSCCSRARPARDTFQLADERDALGATLDVGSSLDLTLRAPEGVAREPAPARSACSPTSRAIRRSRGHGGDPAQAAAGGDRAAAGESDRARRSACCRRWCTGPGMPTAGRAVGWEALVP